MASSKTSVLIFRVTSHKTLTAVFMATLPLAKLSSGPSISRLSKFYTNLAQNASKAN
jgi:hypothetical protein